MKIRIATVLPALILAVSPVLWSQDQAAIQQRVAELKQSIAANRAKLTKYQWQQNRRV